MTQQDSNDRKGKHEKTKTYTTAGREKGAFLIRPSLPPVSCSPILVRLTTAIPRPPPPLLPSKTPDRRPEHLDRPHVLGAGIREPDGGTETVPAARHVGRRAAPHRRGAAEPQPLRPPGHRVGQGDWGRPAVGRAFWAQRVRPRDWRERATVGRPLFFFERGGGWCPVAGWVGLG